jgi:CubicO group peptidase (beta-lactamase class C family)
MMNQYSNATHASHCARFAATFLPILLMPFWVTAQDKSHITSEQVTHAIQELEKLAQKQIQENALPGLAIAIVFQDKTMYAKGFGIRDTSTKAPVDADTVFQLASVSKPIGSTVVAELVGEGKITWDSKLIAPDGKAEVVVENLNVHGEGTFKRVSDRK